MAKVLAVVVTAATVLMAYGTLFGRWEGHSRIATLSVGALGVSVAVLVAAAAWRMSLMGMYLSAGHVHIRNFTSTRTVPWISVTRIVGRREDVYRTEDDVPNSLSTVRLRLVLDDGEEIDTPVQRSSSEQPGRLRLLVLSPADYGRVKQILRTEWHRALAAKRAAGR